MLKVLILTVDNRENSRQYDIPLPIFGTAPEGLLSGLKEFPNEVQVHVACCSQRPLTTPINLHKNVVYHNLHVPRLGWLRSGYFGCIKAFRKLARSIKPDLVHAQGTERDCAISAIFLPYPKLLTIHGNLRLIAATVGFRPFSAMWFQTILEGFVVPHFDGIVCITNYTKVQVEHETPKTWVVPNAVDSSFFDIHRVPSEVSIILCVANIEARKNQNALIRALTPLVQSFAFEVRFFGAIGTGEYAEEFRTLVEDNPWCKYGGMLNRDELRDEFSKAAILALPTKEDNCPMVILEAMASGVPVVASNVGGIPDLIRAGQNGLFCKPESEESMREPIRQLLTSPELCSRLSAEAKADAQKRFHPHCIARRHIEIYKELTA